MGPRRSGQQESRSDGDLPELSAGRPCTRWVRAPAQIPLTQPCSVPALALFALRFKLGDIVPSGL